jgi:hypothetical protein
VNYLSRLASSQDPPDFCLLSSWDSRREPRGPGLKVTLNGILSPCIIHVSRGFECSALNFGKD